MSHGDTITNLPKNCSIESSTEDVEIASFRFNDHYTYGIQYHPEVHHSEHGMELLKNFVYKISNCSPSWTPAAFVKTTVNDLKSAGYTIEYSFGGGWKAANWKKVNGAY